MTKKILKEFADGGAQRDVGYIKSALEHIFGELQQIGGPSRVYEIDETSQTGVVYNIKNTLHGIGLGYKDGLVETIYWWDVLSLYRAPDYYIEIPNQGNFLEMLPDISEMIGDKIEGKVIVA